MPGSVVTPEEVMPRRRPGLDGPRVAVIASLNFPGQAEHVAALIRRFAATTLQTLEDLGADWRLVDPSGGMPDVDDVLDTDAVLLLGGGDVDSEIYGVEGPAPHEYGVDAAADHFSIAVIRGAVASGVPVLGICRGLQLLNVAFGGTLLPDIDDSARHHGPPGGPLMVDEHVEVVLGTRLHALLGTTDVVGRTGHHQAVDDVAPGFEVCAVAADGVIEGIEHPTAWALGVQWHPEDDDGPGDDRLALFSSLLHEAARERGAPPP
jgi:putative glutamine amidotransferase